MNQAKTKRGSTKDQNVCKESFDDKRKNNKKVQKLQQTERIIVLGRVENSFS